MAQGIRDQSLRRAVTIKHVAAEAGVSLQTVSRVINNEPNVRPVVQERVRAAVAKLGYVPSLAARRMGGSRSYLLMALNDRDRTIEGWKSGEGTDWVDQMLMGGMLKCEAHGYRMIFELVDTHSDHVDAAVRGAIAALHPDGVILTPPHSENPAITGLLSQLGLPFARIASIAEGDGFAVSMDDAKAAAFATDHLLGLGHARIGFITGSEEYAVSGARLDGYRRAKKVALVTKTDAASREQITERLLEVQEVAPVHLVEHDGHDAGRRTGRQLERLPRRDHLAGLRVGALTANPGPLVLAEQLAAQP